jgi:hypothetical protein
MNIIGTSPTFDFTKVQSRPVEYYEQQVQKGLILYFINAYLRDSDPVAFITMIHRIFRLKKKAIRNIAIYAKRDVEERHFPLEKVIDCLSFFAIVFVDYIDKDNGQPINKYYNPHA